jgi:hypothetical protein
LVAHPLAPTIAKLAANPMTPHRLLLMIQLLFQQAVRFADVYFAAQGGRFLQDTLLHPRFQYLLTRN